MHSFTCGVRGVAFVVGAFTLVKKLTLVVTIFSFFKITTSCQLCKFFLCHIILKHASRVYNRHGASIDKHQKVPFEFLGTVRQKNRSKMRDKPPLMYKFFRHQKHEFFHDTKSFRDLFCDTLSMVYRKFRTRQMGSANYELSPACYLLKGFFSI